MSLMVASYVGAETCRVETTQLTQIIYLCLTAFILTPGARM